MRDIENKKQYSALTIDTSIFEKNGLKLKEGLLARLSQFKNIPIDFILSDIVYQELHKHLRDKENKAKRELKRALDDASDYLSLNTDIRNELESSLNLDSDEGGEYCGLDEFIERCGIEIIKSKDNLNIDDLIDLYFSS
ncbi:hypothetical protein FHQ28_12605 [Pasteurellaceae bacterium USgator11]|nr:hypothetical protein FHQ19_12060 [Pasteurellaceae bacterium UScroc12]TNG98019.1 hypothetical protein FHQ28_12605 [Pasteurellaceae bacterium USgator11]